MKYPTIPHRNTSRDMIDIFRGYDRNLRIDEGAWSYTDGMTSDYYPIIGTRSKRAVYAAPENAQGLVSKDGLCWVDGTDFVINGYPVDMGLSTNPEDCPKRLVSMGAYVVILPDKKWINTLDLTDFGDIEAKVVTTEDVSFSLCTIDGADYENTVVGPDAPEDPENLQYWVDTSGSVNTLKQYSAASAVWVAVPTTYVKIHSTGIGKPFDQYDGVNISGILSDDLKDLNASMVIWAKGDDYIVVTGIIDRQISQESDAGAVTVERSMPYMDFVTQAGNRLWGCRYGIASNGEVVNEIYASKLGDFKNWNCFMGLSTDSWVGGVGTDGQFTGAITHLGYPVFFKEGHLHKVYISAEGAHQIIDTACRGVQKGSARSLAIVNEILFYKSVSGVCSFDGSLPVEVSAALGAEKYCNAVGGSFGNKYYISMDDMSGKHHLFAFDTTRNIWIREGDFSATAFCESSADMFAIDAKSGNIVSFGGDGEPEDAVKWQLESGDLLLSLPDRKYVTCLNVRLRLDTGRTATFYAKYDDDIYWTRLFTIKGNALKSASVPIRPRRCDHMRLRIDGAGDFKLYSITKSIERGSDLR